jgi:hypothetical protein
VTTPSQDNVDREIADGQAAYDALIADGLTHEEIRDLWLAMNGLKLEDMPHDG